MQKRLFSNILDFEKPVDFCCLSKVIVEGLLNISFLFIWFHNVCWFLLYLNFVQFIYFTSRRLQAFLFILLINLLFFI